MYGVLPNGLSVPISNLLGTSLMFYSDPRVNALARLERIAQLPLSYVQTPADIAVIRDELTRWLAEVPDYAITPAMTFILAYKSAANSEVKIPLAAE